jgi:hypothetical protein
MFMAKKWTWLSEDVTSCRHASHTLHNPHTEAHTHAITRAWVHGRRRAGCAYWGVSLNDCSHLLASFCASPVELATTHTARTTHASLLVDVRVTW